MKLLDLLTRWLADRGGDTVRAGRGVRVQLATRDPLTAALGEQFTLAEMPVEASVPPGVEPVYPGCRIADLLAGDVEGVSGIAVVSDGGLALVEPVYVFSFRATYVTDARTERRVRFALDASGQMVSLPPEIEPPIHRAEDGTALRDRVERLPPAATAATRWLASDQIGPIEREAQRRLYYTARRLESYFRQQRSRASDGDEI